ncbi:MAG: hypothetical protein K9L68_03915 [Spirochaetales bacterium]|nr:hypothetical protein [Spirochaetales bacterium]MCF7937725.1 hypothetical protein [Spirochaetales bacterium]
MLRFIGKPLFGILLFAAVSVLLPAAEWEDLQNVLNFDADLQYLDQQITEPDPDLDSARFYLIDGAVASITIADDRPENYTVLVELVRGNWIGMERVERYSCLIQFQGPEYQDIFPARRSRNPSSEAVEQNDNLLVVARLAGVTEDFHGNPVPALVAYDMRRLP